MYAVYSAICMLRLMIYLCKFICIQLLVVKMPHDIIHDFDNVDQEGQLCQIYLNLKP